MAGNLDMVGLRLLGHHGVQQLSSWLQNTRYCDSRQKTHPVEPRVGNAITGICLKFTVDETG